MIRSCYGPDLPYNRTMRFHRLGSSLAVVFVCAALAACGGGGGGGGATGGPPPTVPTPTPTPVATSTPVTPAGGYVAPTGNVTQLGPTTNNQFSSSLLAASSDGTFVVQSTDTPAEPSGSSATLTEYDVSASESAAGQKPSSAGRSIMTTRTASALARADGAALPFRPRMDAGESALRATAQRLTRSLVHVSGRNTESVRRPQSFTTGATRTFHVLEGTITGVGGSCTAPQVSVGGQCYLDVPATLQYVSAHGYVWVDNGLDASYNLGTADWQATGNAFDADYARETVAFGPAFFNANGHYTQCDTTGAQLPQNQYQAPVDLSGTDPHISILVTKALESTGEGGYFFSLDLVNDQEYNCATKAPHPPSNALPMFVIGADKYQTGSGTVADESYWRTTDMPRSLPHEFQHYLHAISKIYIPNLVNNVAGSFDDAFVDEGDAMLAQDLVKGTGQDVNALESGFEYLFNPANYSLTSFTGYDADPLDTSSNPVFGFFHSTVGNYGAAYLFQRYLYDRFGGDAAMHRQYASLTSTSSGANVNPVVAEAGNGETFAQLYADFAAALAARNVASTDPRFTFSSNVTLVGTKQIPIPGGQTWDMVLNGPRSPDDLTSTHPNSLPRIKLTASSTVSAKLITGATLFFNAAPSAGSIVSLNSTSAPLGRVDGALVQGPYNDNGSCLGPAPGC
jgi:hypothetical protein